MNQTLWCPKKDRNQHSSACITCKGSFENPICKEWAKLTEGENTNKTEGEKEMAKKDEKPEVEAKAPKAEKTEQEKIEQKERQVEGIKKSWENPETAKARKARHGVKVGGVVYGSLKKAFDALELPDNKHIAFRGKLKKSGKETFEYEAKKYNFTLTELPKKETKTEATKGAEKK